MIYFRTWPKYQNQPTTKIARFADAKMLSKLKHASHTALFILPWIEIYAN